MPQMLDLAQPRLWSLGDYAKAIAALANAERQKWLAIPALLLASDSSTDAGAGQFTTINTDVRNNPYLQGNASETLPPISAQAVLAAPSVSLGEGRLMVPLVALRSKPEEQRLTVGRVPTCDVVLPLPSISRVHAYAFGVGPDSAEFEDAGSKNGTVYQSDRLDLGVRVGLEDGGRITFGEVEVEFCSAGRLGPALMSLALDS